MDRSFLSNESVVTASRRFTCVRLLTYESAEEADVLKSFFVGRSGQLENTTFALVAPDGKTKLARAGRSPDFAFRGGAGKTPAQEMAEAMDEIAARLEKTQTAESGASPLPVTKTVRLGLDVAACDGLPLVVVYGDDAAKRAALTERLALLAWNATFVGRFTYVVGAAADVKPIEGATSKAGLLVVEPDEFGMAGTVLTQAPIDAAAAKITAALTEGLKRHHATAKDPRSHIEAGHRAGVHWETVIPDTDPGPPGGGPPP